MPKDQLKRRSSKRIGAPARRRSPTNAVRRVSGSRNHSPLSPEMTWLQTHLEALRGIEGQWVLLTSSGILAHGKDYSEVDAEATANGIRIPFIFRVPDFKEDEVFMGL